MICEWLSVYVNKWVYESMWVCNCDFKLFVKCVFKCLLVYLSLCIWVWVREWVYMNMWMCVSDWIYLRGECMCVCKIECMCVIDSLYLIMCKCV